MKKTLAGAAAAVVFATVNGMLPAVADDTGFASAHDWRKERGLTCMSDHWHYGSGSPAATRAKAERSAISSWSSFTDFEYGSNWARWGKAGSKKMACTNGAGGWTCSAEARPCR